MLLQTLLFVFSASPIPTPAPWGLIELPGASLSMPPIAHAQGHVSELGAPPEKEPENQDSTNKGTSASDDAEPDLPPEAVARVGGRLISLDEYKEELFRLNGYGPLGDFIHRRLLNAEGERLGLVVTESELEIAWNKEWTMMLARSRGNQAEVEANLQSLGYTIGRYRAQYFIGQRATMIENKIIKHLRIPEEKALRLQFDFQYGLNGERVVLRHLMLNRSRTKSALQAAATPAELMTNNHLDRAMEKKAVEILSKVREGQDFEALCRAESHDLSVTQNAGVIPGYNFKHYGSDVAKAAHTAPVGEVVGPITATAGLHLLRVESRVVTRFEDVKDVLFAELKANDASYAERAALTGRLFRETEVERRR
jgi:hypothetical protein